MTDLEVRDVSRTAPKVDSGLVMHPQFRLDRYTRSSDLAEIWFQSLMLESGFRSSGNSSCDHEGTLSDLLPGGFVVQASCSGREGITSLLASASDAHLLLER